MYDTAHMEMPMYAYVQPIKNGVTFDHTKTEPVCSIYLGKCLGGHSPYAKEKSLAKELVCLNTL